jgi:hypothetical protein
MSKNVLKDMQLEIEQLKAHIAELETLMALQRRRAIKAAIRYMAANECKYFPDLEELIAWLMTQADKRDARIAELEAAQTKHINLLKRLAWICWNLDCNEELPDDIGGDLYSELMDYVPGPDDFANKPEVQG